MTKCSLLVLAIVGLGQTMQAQEDNYQWLEEVDGKRALEFVATQNKITIDKLTNEKDYPSIYSRSLEILNSSERIPSPTIHGKYAYNFWKDKGHERGIWRRCVLSDYTNAKPNWESLLDIDELSKKDSINWVFKEATGLHPSYSRFLVQLSKGGGDAVVTKEFDVDKKQFIENGFFVEESKGSVSFIEENILIVASDFGEGSMTTSGYPRQVKIWKRGTLLKDAPLIYEGQSTDMGCWVSTGWDGKTCYPTIHQMRSFYDSKKLIWLNNKLVTLDIPDDADSKGLLKNQLLVLLKSDWKVETKTHKSGTLISLRFTELLKGKKEVQVIIEPDKFSSISEISTTKNKLLLNVLTNVTSQLYVYSFDKGQWTHQKVQAPDFGTISLISADEFSDQYFFQFENFITPSTLYAADASALTVKANKSLPAFFDGSKYEVKQYKAKSKEGTLVPYFVVAAKDIKYDGETPTLLYAYGGFEISIQPFYASQYGAAWLDKGGAFVLANIRGGGEFGPKWHQAGLKEKRQRVFEDFYAVSEDLLAKKVTSPKHLGIKGGSNGGLLVGTAFTQRPELYNAVVCIVPLLDMQRYNKLLAGASWMGEYGNPDVPAEWDYIKKYSPYQNIKAGMNYPEVFFTTSTRDDRVHPGHARKMVAKMNDLGYKTYYYENIEGGHAGASTNEQTAKLNAFIFSYLLMKLK